MVTYNDLVRRVTYATEPNGMDIIRWDLKDMDTSWKEAKELDRQNGVNVMYQCIDQDLGWTKVFKIRNIHPLLIDKNAASTDRLCSAGIFSKSLLFLSTSSSSSREFAQLLSSWIQHKHVKHSSLKD